MDCKMKNAWWICLGIILLFIILLFITVTIATIINTKGYRVSKKNNYIPYAGTIDIYNASREELIELDMCNYPVIFGEVENENEASQIAAKVINEVYQKDESPYIVKFNKNANAWIVSGSIPLFHLGGVASIAIDKETGEILMLIHTK